MLLSNYKKFTIQKRKGGFMSKFMDFMEERLLPIAGKLSANKYLQGINKGFMIILPLTIFGSLFTLLANFPVPGWTDLMAELGLTSWLNIPSKLTVDMISIYTTIAIAYSFTKQEGHNGIAGGFGALLSFLILTPLVTFATGETTSITTLDISWFGAKGLFVAMLVGLLVAKLFIILTEKGLVIKLPDGVPPMVSQSFSSLVPIFIIGTLMLVIAYIFGQTSFGSVHSLVYTFVATPLQSVGGSFGGMIVFTIALHLLWFFGIHGGNVVNSIANPLLLPLALENLAAFQAGQTPVNIYSSAFKNTYQFGGGGMTISLCILMIFVAKSQRYKALGKLALPANVFYINEPIIFGTPIVLNTTMLIPFILAPLTTAILAYVLTAIGVLPVLIGYQIPWTMPPIVSGFIQGGWQVALYQVFSIGLTFAIYYPFFKAIDKQAIIEEDELAKE